MLQAERTASKSHLLVMRFRAYRVCAQLCGGLRAIVQCCIAVSLHTALVSSPVSSRLCFNMLSHEVGWGGETPPLLWSCCAHLLARYSLWRWKVEPLPLIFHQIISFPPIFTGWAYFSQENLVLWALPLWHEALPGFKPTQI